MNSAGGARAQQILLSRRHAIADAWHEAITQTGFVSFKAMDVRQRLAEFTEEAVALLIAEPFERGRAEAMGASLAGFHYVDPAALGKTQEVLAQQFVEGLSAEQVLELHPRLATLLGGLTTGFLQQAHETARGEQERIHGALTRELQRVEGALRTAYEEVGLRVQERTAELCATNESLQREIAERKQAEEALRESEETARVLLNAPPDLASLIDVKGFILDANEAMSQRYGMDVKELIGLYSWDLIPLEVAERRKPYFHQVIESGKPVYFEDKREGRWFYTVFYPVLDEKGEVTKVAALSRDIDDRKRVEEALRKAHDELEVRVRERTAELARVNEALQGEIIVRKRAEQALRNERDMAEALAEEAAIVSSTLNPDEVLDHILERVSRVVPNDATNVMLIEGERARIARWRGYENFGGGESISTLELHIPEIPGFQQMIESKEPMVIPDTATYSDWVQVQEWLRSYAAAPIVVNGEVIGFLNVDSALPGFFTQAHAEALRAFANHAAIALKNAQLYEAAQQEIAERKQVEQELIRLSAAVKASVDSIVTFDVEGKITDANEATLKLYGTDDKGDLIGKHILEVIAPEYREQGLAGIEFVLEKGYDQSAGYEVITRDGRRIPVELSAAVMRDADGKPIGIAGIARDITERKRAEGEIRRRNRELTALNAIATAMIQSALHLDEVLQRTAEGIVEGLGCNTAYIFLLDEEEEIFKGRAVSTRARILARMDAIIGSPLLRTRVPSSRDFNEAMSNLLDGRATIKHDFYELAGPLWSKRVCSALQKLLDSRTFFTIPLLARGKTVGGIVASTREELGEEDTEKLMTFANQAAIAIQNAQLYEAERAARDRLRDLASYLAAVREEERTHIAREIHDEFGQALTALKMDVAWLTKRLPADNPGLVEKANAMSDLIASTLQTVRRIATDLRPGMLDHLGLVAAIEWQTQELAGRAGLDCELLLGDEEIVLDPDLATAIFRIFQETLTNVVRHAEASTVRVELEERPDEVLLVVQDNGKGITTDQVSGHKSLGLIGMQERARSWGGDVTFQATPGQGTTATLRVPRGNAKKEEGWR